MSEAEPQHSVPKPKLRWFQYSLRTLLCAPVVLAVVFSWPHVHRRYIVWRLEKYDGTDLMKLPDEEQQRVIHWIASLIGQKLDDPIASIFGPQNWLLHSSDSLGAGRRLLVIQMEPTMSIPGNSYCVIHLLDNWGRLVHSMTFNIGYRAWPEAATIDESQHGFLCLTVMTEHTWIGKTRQFYCITDKYAELLRHERIDGKFAMGDGNSFDVEEKPPDWSEWTRLLESPDRLQQLRGLAAFWSYDNLEHLRPIEEKARLRLEHLSKSADPWISEESKWALRFLADRRAVPALQD